MIASPLGQVSAPHRLKNCLDNCCPTVYFTIMTPLPSRQARTGRPFDSPEQEAFLSLWRTYDRLRALEDELFGRHDLTAQQYNTLRLLRGRHPETVPPLTLAARRGSRAPDITRLLDRLEARGLIRRERLADNR